MSGSGFLIGVTWAAPDRDFCGPGRIKVVPKGRYHPVYSLRLNGKEIADLAWHGPRRVRYTVRPDGDRIDMKVGHMKRKIRAVDIDGRLSRIMVSSNRHLGRRNLRLQMADGDNFVVTRGRLDRWCTARFDVRKEHYVNSLLVFHFNSEDPSAPILIDVERLMRWEMPHFHWLLALVTARISLERRMNHECWLRD